MESRFHRHINGLTARSDVNACVGLKRTSTTRSGHRRELGHTCLPVVAGKKLESRFAV